MIVVLLLVLLGACLLAGYLGVDTSDSRSERARPDVGWYPPSVPS